MAGKNGKGKLSKVLVSESMVRKEVREEYEKKICLKQGEARMIVEEEESVSSGCSKMQ